MRIQEFHNVNTTLIPFKSANPPSSRSSSRIVSLCTPDRARRSVAGSAGPLRAHTERLAAACCAYSLLTTSSVGSAGFGIGVLQL